MVFIDTHSHIYDSAFDVDRDEVVARAQVSGVERILLPAIDSESHLAMFDLVKKYPDYCIAMMGLHPTSVNVNYINELEIVERLLSDPKSVGVDRFCAVGEIGLDLYWSQQWSGEQRAALCAQLELALRHDLPIVVHTREAWAPMHEVMREYRGRGLRGVMHAFGGTYDDYKALKECGDFLFGVGGVVTYKRSEIAALVPRMSLSDIVLETDAPYLTPVPYRGKRNESSYVGYVCDKVAELLGISADQVSEATTQSAKRMFPHIG